MFKKLGSVIKESPLTSAAMLATTFIATGAGMQSGLSYFMIVTGIGVAVCTLFKAMDYTSRGSSR